MIEKIDQKTKSTRGGKRAGSGRKKGTQNRATIELKQLAGAYTEEAVQVFVDVMRDAAEPGSVRVAAADKLLDRAHGRPAVHIETVNNKVDAELMSLIETRYLTGLEQARLRQRQVLIERGIIIEG